MRPSLVWFVSLALISLPSVGCPSKTAPTGQRESRQETDKTSKSAEPKPVEPKKPEYRPPATRPGEKGWEEYVDPEPLTPEKAKELSPGSSSPEAALLHFYASRMRGDERYREVLVPKPSQRLQRKLKKYDTWKFLEIRLVGKKQQGDDPDVLWIKIFMKIEYEPGKFDSGQDEAGVRKVDGKWLVESVPT